MSAPPFPSWRSVLSSPYRRDEDDAVRDLLTDAQLPRETQSRIRDRARTLVTAVRKNQTRKGGVEAFMREYDLSTQEGLTLMCLAETLLRIPDAQTADRVIRDKLSATDWKKHLGHSSSLLVNASTIGLMLSGRLLTPADLSVDDPRGVMTRLVARLGEPVIRRALHRAMRLMGRHFVLGETIGEAIKRGAQAYARGYRYSFDMLGEAARTEADAAHYYAAYERAIHAIGRASDGAGPEKGSGISVKLSALHPRYEPAKRDIMMDVMVRRTLALARLAKSYDIGFCIDAEEAERLELSLEIFEAVYADPSLDGWTGYGLAIQAYSKRARPVIDILAGMVERVGRRMNVRLVKGAYWDSEIKHAQELGMSDFPLYTRKVGTDVSYLACARRLFDHGERFFPQFATHNAHSVASALELADGRPFEFQRLHGMGEDLYEEITPKDKMNIPCRIYAPVGGHAALLSYLVRRLLENGANTSFVNRLADPATPLEDIITDPVEHLTSLPVKRHPRIALPRHLYGPERLNSAGIDLSDSLTLEALQQDMARHSTLRQASGPIINGQERLAPSRPVTNPAQRSEIVGTVCEGGKDDANAAVSAALDGFPAWSTQPVEKRAAALETAADRLEADTASMMDLCIREAGKTLTDALAEVREAVDFLRYYANEARRHSANGLRGRGVFVCISPWNFPLAIFTGQISAALAVGNTVVAKPAEQTPLVAAAMVRLLHRAGIPPSALHLLPGDGSTVGAALAAHPRLAGVAFTGSESVAHLLNKTLAARDEALPFIAETGGLNAMLVDSSALPEQVIRDVVISAFGSAGQRCSALRVLFVQSESADSIIAMLKGAMDALRVGNPRHIDTDIGPVITDDALETLHRHAQRMDREGRLIHGAPLPESCAHGTFFAPRAYELDSLSRLTDEVFGPILHVIRYEPRDLDGVLRAIQATGYGLTMGLHTRIDAQVRRIQAASAIGNTYVNRTMIGAVVGSQPFGGEGRSGTGPKAGGPHYLPRYGRQENAAHTSRLPPKAPPAEPTRAVDPFPNLPVLPPLRLSSPQRVSLGRRLEKSLSAMAEELTALLVRDTQDDADAVARAVLAAAPCVAKITDQAAADLASPQPLPGPTGERNELLMVPRGTVLLIAAHGASWDNVMGRLGAILTGGNRVILVSDPTFGAALHRIVTALDLAADHLSQHVLEVSDTHALAQSLAVHAVSLEGTLPGLLAALAQRSDAIIPLDAEPLSAATLYRTMSERSLSWDTTAAGGNATLLGLSEEGPATTDVF